MVWLKISSISNLLIGFNMWWTFIYVVLFLLVFIYFFLILSEAFSLRNPSSKYARWWRKNIIQLENYEYDDE